MLVMWPTTEIGAKAENRLTKTMNSRFERQGVRNLGWISEKTLGSRPSRDIEKNTRDWPSSITRITDVNPAMIAILISGWSHLSRACRRWPPPPAPPLP